MPRLGGLLLLAASSEGIYLALAHRYGLFAAKLGELHFLWLYGALVVLYLGACWLAWSSAGIWAKAATRRTVLLAVIGAAVVFRLTLLPEPAADYDDIYRYVWDGRVVAVGINPYAYPPSAAELDKLAVPARALVNNPNVITPYPPAAEVTFGLLHRLWPDSLLAVKAAFLACDLATIGLLLALLRHFRQPALWVIVYAWSPLPIQEFAGHGHVDALMLPLLLAALLLALRGQGRASAVALGLATLMKLVPLLLLPTFLRRWGWRGLLVFTAVLVLGVAPFLGAGASFMGGLGPMAERWEANGSLYRLAVIVNERWLSLVDAESLYRQLWLSAVIAAASLLGLRRTGPGRPDSDTLATDRRLLENCFWVFAVFLLLGTTVFPWYATWLLPLLTVLLAVSKGSAARPAYFGCWLFTCLVGAFYLRYLTGQLPEWATFGEYAPVYLGLAAAGLARLRPRLAIGAARTRPAPIAGASEGPRVGVVIPTLNEEAAIGAVIAAIPREFAAEVIVVDGGSRDRTVERASAGGARVIHEARRGYGRACATGAASLADAERQIDVVVFLDGDYSDHPEEMGRLVEPIAAGRADLVVGSRLRGQRQPGALPLHSLLGNWLGALIMRVLYGLPISDLGPFRAIRAEALASLEMAEMTYGWPVEMLAKAARRGLRVAEVPVSYRPRLGHSKITGTWRGSLLASYYILSRIVLYARDRPQPQRVTG